MQEFTLSLNGDLGFAFTLITICSFLSFLLSLYTVFSLNDTHNDVIDTYNLLEKVDQKALLVKSKEEPKEDIVIVPLSYLEKRQDRFEKL